MKPSRFRCTSRLACWPFCAVIFLALSTGALAQSWQIGTAKRDITPTEPVRLSGYAARSRPTIEIADNLSVRALVFQHESKAAQIIVSIDSIGLSAKLTDRILDQLTSTIEITRDRIVFCTTHSHTSPHLDGGLTNLFGGPLIDEENAAMLRYSDLLVKRTVECVIDAHSHLQSGNIEYGLGSADFAINRRLGARQPLPGFGSVADGPVDHTVRVLRATDRSGHVLAIAFQYACHCTSINPELNKVSADWAGIAAELIEKQFPGSVALPIIGCGADANPSPRGKQEDAIAHGKSLAQSVHAICTGSLKPLPAPTQSAFAFAALEPERPSRERLVEMSKSDSKFERHFAKTMLDILQAKNRLPETYPAPVHFWGFGDELVWIFLGGEVVVDYQMRLEKEFSQYTNVWVAAYVDDCFAYVASERIRNEGGYEAETSMLYYNQPGRWVSGTEDLLVARILEMSRQKRAPNEPLSAAESLKSIQVSDGWKIELVASEPLIVDPVNIGFGADGKVWVLEMGDYPLGGGRAGRVKVLTDTDHDGTMDSASVFLDGLEYPAGLYPWRNGVVVACAPEVFFAEDTNQDGVADKRITLLTGFPPGNPQHRVHGFTYGLDNRLYFGPGGGVGNIGEVAQADGLTRGKTEPRELSAAGSDIALDVERGVMRIETGTTQYIRACDAWDNWFGNENSLPMFHYVVASEWLRFGSTTNNARFQHLTTPAVAPPVHPISQNLNRFNDLFAANRFTSACSSIICKSEGVGEAMSGAALICEPVHNLVARYQRVPDGSSWKAVRFDQDAQSDWVRSSDPWFRPVRVENGPDGAIWIVDMYRQVIEHPEWIPDEWQHRLNLRAGENQGRIYRVSRSDYHRPPSENLLTLSDEHLLDRLASPNASLADLAQQTLIWRNDENKLESSTYGKLHELIRSSLNAGHRLRALATLSAMSRCEEKDWLTALNDSDPRLVRVALRWITRSETWTPALQSALTKLIATNSESKSESTTRSWFDKPSTNPKPAPVSQYAPALALELLMTAHQQSLNGFASGQLIAEYSADPWIVACLPLLRSNESGIDQMVAGMLDRFQNSKSPQLTTSIQPCLAALIPYISNGYRKSLMEQVTSQSSLAAVRAAGYRSGWHFLLAREFARDQSLAESIETSTWDNLTADARANIANASLTTLDRTTALAFLISRMNSSSSEEIAGLVDVLASTNNMDVERQIARSLIALGPESLTAILTKWSSYSQELKSTILAESVAKSSLAEHLLKHVSSGQIKSDEIDLAIVQRLRSPSYEHIAAQVNTLFGPPPGSDRLGLVADYLSKWPTRNDRDSGLVHYKKHCAVCHENQGAGASSQSAIGPNLDALSNWTNETWLTAILAPHRSVEEKYRSIQIQLNDGKTLVGLKTREDGNTIECITSDGKRESIDKGEISQLKESNLSLMPEGFERLLQPQDIADIVTYLRGRR